MAIPDQLDTSTQTKTPYTPKKGLESSGMMEAGERQSENDNMAIREIPFEFFRMDYNPLNVALLTGFLI